MSFKEKLKNFNIHRFMGLVFVLLALYFILIGIINSRELTLLIGLVAFIIHLCFSILEELYKKNEEAQK